MRIGFRASKREYWHRGSVCSKQQRNIESYCKTYQMGCKKIIESGGSKVEGVDDTYVLYIQMQQTAAKCHYKLLMLDAKEKERERVRLTVGEKEAEKLPKGKRIECEVEPGYISHCGVMGWGSRRLNKIK